MPKDMYEESLASQNWEGRLSALEEALERYRFIRENCQQCNRDDGTISMDGTCAKTREVL